MSFKSLLKADKADRDDIYRDLDQLGDSLKEIIDSLGSDAQDEVDLAKKKGEALLKEVRSRISTDRYGIKQATRDTVSNVDFYVYDKPWQSVGIGATVGLIIGALLAAKCKS